MKPLTPRQQETVEMMKAYHAKNGYYPMLREIGQALGLKRASSAFRLIDELIAKGYAKKQDHKHRSVFLTEKAL